MNGKIILITDNAIVAKLENGRFVRHDRNEHRWQVGDEVVTLEGSATLYMPATSGHVYLTADYISKEGENVVDEHGYISKDGVPL